MAQGAPPCPTKLLLHVRSSMVVRSSGDLCYGSHGDVWFGGKSTRQFCYFVTRLQFGPKRQGKPLSERDSDWAGLMRAAINGDAAAYNRLLTSLAPAIRADARRGLGAAGLAAEEAEDIVHETLLAIHLKRHTWDSTMPLGPWVRAIARNKLIDAMRRRGDRAYVPIDDVVDTLAADAEEPTPLPG